MLTLFSLPQPCSCWRPASLAAALVIRFACGSRARQRRTIELPAQAPIQRASSGLLPSRGHAAPRARCPICSGTGCRPSDIPVAPRARLALRQAPPPPATSSSPGRARVAEEPPGLVRAHIRRRPCRAHEARTLRNWACRCGPTSTTPLCFSACPTPLARLTPREPRQGAQVLRAAPHETRDRLTRFCRAVEAAAAFPSSAGTDLREQAL